MNTPENIELPFELDSLSDAVNYQKWIMSSIYPFLGESILEVGAGIGSMSRWLPVRKKLYITEYNQDFENLLKNEMYLKHGDDKRIIVEHNKYESGWQQKFFDHNIDTIVNFNVLEHIDNDSQVLSQWLDILSSNSTSQHKRLVIFVPAHQWAFSKLDKKYGHYRRYNHKTMIKALSKITNYTNVSYQYFNIIGLLGWVFKYKILKNESISKKDIRIFERLVPFIKNIDDFLHHKLKIRIGQSMIFVVTV